MNGQNQIKQDREVVHHLSAVNRETITVQGVKDVLSFDEQGVLLVTPCGSLALEGENLHVTVLNTRDGVVEVTGKLNGLLYDDEESSGTQTSKGKGRPFGRFFR